MAIVYIHMKPHNREIYYVGIGNSISRSNRNEGRNDRWQKVFKKYGKTVEIISTNISLDAARELEKFLIKSIGRLDKNEGTLTNMQDGGEGGFGHIPSESVRKESAERLKGNTYRRGAKLSEDTKRKIGEKSKGRSWSAESKEKLSKTNGKVVLDTASGVYYNSIREAAIYNNIKETTLKYQLYGTHQNKTNLIIV